MAFKTGLTVPANITLPTRVLQLFPNNTGENAYRNDGSGDEEPCYRDNNQCQEIPNPPRDILVDENSIWVPFSDVQLHCHSYYEGPRAMASAKESPQKEWIWKETVLNGKDVYQNLTNTGDSSLHYIYLDADSLRSTLDPNSSSNGTDHYGIMVTIFKPLIAANVDVKRLLPYLDFIDCEGVRIAERRDKRIAVSFLLDELQISTESGKWHRFLHALEDTGYSYIVDNLKGNDVIDHTYQKKYLAIIAQVLRQLIDPAELLAHLRSTGVINGQDVQEIDCYQRRYGTIGAADKLLERVHKMHQFWYVLFIKALANAEMTEAVDMLDIPEITGKVNSTYDEPSRYIDDNQTFVKVARMHVERDKCYYPTPMTENTAVKEREETIVKSLKSNVYDDTELTRMKEVANADAHNDDKHLTKPKVVNETPIQADGRLNKRSGDLHYLQPEPGKSWTNRSSSSSDTYLENQFEELYVSDDECDLSGRRTEVEMQEIAELPALPSLLVQNTQPKTMHIEEKENRRRYTPHLPVARRFTENENEEGNPPPLPMRNYLKSTEVIYKPPVPVPRSTLVKKETPIAKTGITADTTQEPTNGTLDTLYMEPKLEEFPVSGQHLFVHERQQERRSNTFPQMNPAMSEESLQKSTSDSHLNTMIENTNLNVLDEGIDAHLQKKKDKDSDAKIVTNSTGVRKPTPVTPMKEYTLNKRSEAEPEDTNMSANSWNIGHVHKMKLPDLVKMHKALKEELSQTNEKLPLLEEVLSMKKEYRDRLHEMRAFVQEYKNYQTECAALQRAMEKDDNDSPEEDPFSYNPPDAISGRRKAIRRQRNVSESSDHYPNDANPSDHVASSFSGKPEVGIGDISEMLHIGHHQPEGVTLIPYIQNTGKHSSGDTTYKDSAFYSSASVSTKL